MQGFVGQRMEAEKATGGIEEDDKCVNHLLWRSCAGELVEVPPVNSMVYYIPQGHAEHALTPVNFDSRLNVPALVPCLVTSVKYMAEPETDDIFAKIGMVPLSGNGFDCNREDEPVSQEKLEFEKKNLTQSDANSGGSFSVPKNIAESLFPRLDYSARKPLQFLVAKDVHGVGWSFRHIYRGTPQRHLLTTGWSAFLNSKKLAFGDLVIFLRDENGDLRVGFRRVREKKRTSDDRLEPPSLPPPASMANQICRALSSYLKDRSRSKNVCTSICGQEMRPRGKVRADSVIEAATLAANGKPFEVTYYPATGTPEFVVKASKVRAAMEMNWRPGMRFKMAFELDNFSKTSWSMGVVSVVQPSDPIRWPNSPWRLFQVLWDEGSGVPQELNSVSPWQLEPTSKMPPIILSSIPLSRMKVHIPHHSDIPVGIQSPATIFPHWRSSLYLPSSMQGARHSFLYGIPPKDISNGNLQCGIFHAAFLLPDRTYSPPPTVSGAQVITSDSSFKEQTMTNEEENSKEGKKKPETVPLRLFGTPVYPDEQLSLRISSSSVASSSDREEINIPKVRHHSSSSQKADTLATNYQAAHCKVFMEYENVGRVIDLSAIVSLEDLYYRLLNMFEVHISDLVDRIVFRDAANAEVKLGTDEPFMKFLKKVKRLTILRRSRGNSKEKLYK
ncbi:Auxin response factor 18 [Apostasia shenzhenica]|uniref:Auxin response factor n=1 Tax=Apostasia shenzhenica TaxID=1088818 RepID=A0A2I0B2B2_9ASPA|nr:Auxin response factor 18 [Apostasia shenzhenica]